VKGMIFLVRHSPVNRKKKEKKKKKFFYFRFFAN
jgi:hypothetical protein